MNARARGLAKARNRSEASTALIEGTPGRIGARAKAESFTFSLGDAEPVLGRRGVLDHIQCWANGRWYSPPIDLDGLAKVRWASPHHASAIQIRINMLTAHLEPHRWLNRQVFEGLVLDHLVFGNAYAERIDNIANRPMAIERPLARYVRRGIEPGRFYQLQPDNMTGLMVEHAFEPRSVLQLMAPDLNQDIYGVPEYLGALQSMFLNEEATLFRVRYYRNGSHAGFILYSTDEGINQDDADKLREALRNSKGGGAFRNIFVHAPRGKKDGLQLIPISEIAAKDEFIGIKGTSRDDILAAWRTPPQLLGIVPNNAGGFGDVGKAAEVFFHQEITPLMGRFTPINDWLGEEVVRFKPYQGVGSAGVTVAAS